MKLFAAVLLCIVVLCSITACKTSISTDLLSNNHPLIDDGEPVADFAKTTYPIVLVHGLFGFESMFGIDYFYQIPDVLREGGAEVFVARVSGTTTPEERGEQLIIQLDDWVAIHGLTKFNLMGHSLGGPTIRYVAATRPELVASITTISGANYGTKASDSELANLPLVSDIIGFMGNILGHVIDMVSQANFEQNMKASVEAMSESGVLAFNSQYPTALPTTTGAGYCNGAEATGGFSHGVLTDYTETGWQTGANFVGYYANDIASGGPAGPYMIAGHAIRFYSFSGNHAVTNQSDPLDGMHRAVSRLIPGDDDDGFVNRCSTHIGYVIKDNFVMNHLDVMNWFVGLRDSRAPYPPIIYRAHANRLKFHGL